MVLGSPRWASVAELIANWGFSPIKWLCSQRGLKARGDRNEEPHAKQSSCMLEYLLRLDDPLPEMVRH